jgi:hypothetical protein
LSFEVNQGQINESVKFVSRGPGYGLFLKATEAVFMLSTTPGVLRMQLIGANSSPEVRGIDELPGKTNYFRGNNPANWRTNVPTYRKVHYSGVIPAST